MVTESPLPWVNWRIHASDIVIIKDNAGLPVKLGNGATHTVFQATVRGVEAAVKQFQKNHVHTDDQQALDFLKSCRDPHIVNAIGACMMNGHIMLALELMEDDLHNKLSLQPAVGWSWYKSGKQIAMDVACGLDFLHSHHIIHYNLKSPKILLAEDGTAKINNLLCRNPEAWTFAWAAPEILMGNECTEKVDMYSYGVILWELVTGEQPRRGQLRECNVPAECPEEVRTLINRCLAFQPEERPSCREVIKLLSNL